MPAEIIDAAELVVGDIFYGESPDGQRNLFLATDKAKYGNHSCTWASLGGDYKPAMFNDGFSVVREDPTLWVRFQDLPLFTKISFIPLSPNSRPFGSWMHAFSGGFIKNSYSTIVNNPDSPVSTLVQVNHLDMWCRIEPFELWSSVGKPMGGVRKPEFNHTATKSVLAFDIYKVKGA